MVAYIGHSNIEHKCNLLTCKLQWNRDYTSMKSSTLWKLNNQTLTGYTKCLAPIMSVLWLSRTVSGADRRCLKSSAVVIFSCESAYVIRSNWKKQDFQDIFIWSSVKITMWSPHNTCNKHITVYMYSSG